jgi:AraC family ethanolamine operon transcriptional activator
MSSVDHDQVRVQRVWDRGGIEMDGAVNDDALLAVFLWGNGVEVNGVRQQAPRLVLLGSGTQIRTRQPEEYRYIRIGLRGAALSGLLHDPQAEAAIRMLAKPGVHRDICTPATERRLQERILHCLAFADAAALRGIEVRAALATAVSEAKAELVTALTVARPDRPRDNVTSASRRSIVDAAIELLHANPDEPVSVSAVCSALGVSERALQRAFQECIGTGLRAFERHRRLHAVHGAIISTGDRRSITEIAMSFGFWHLGRFSAAYAALYGCSPAESRRRIWGARLDAPDIDRNWH